ncbi:MAG TPA: bifunctional alpha,alpha-trehalose-phosphate synthase (UDP-forming)/trehalose-phosphatase [Acidobacteriota bacterium]|nr:bifunctional alpha,alpha-trehalose-phosphate synthase (UDP-forming)/trehalose-phosphatase [Acidobacteriota bacterium]
MKAGDTAAGRLIIVSNRLPFTVRVENGELRFEGSAGGLVTGLSSFLDSYKYHFPRQEKHVWVGWPGNTIPDELQERVRSWALSECRAYPVFLSETEMDQFYFGYCNKTIWPLFHYFPSYVAYEEDFWQNYRRVNELFSEALCKLVRPDDVIWVQDYHLMLLPRLLREKIPQALIGFFLHIPFPSYDIFRLLPRRWGSDILEGLLGADLVGFHTYDYMQHFLQSVLRILGYEHHMGQISLANHVVKVETYPMGIDFRKFSETSKAPETQQEREQLQQTLTGFRTLLSIDRLDYSKGIVNRLEGFELLLDSYPEFRGKLVLIMVVVPSRIGVVHYESMKKQIEELVGRINGKFGSIGWTPVLYQYRHLSIHSLSALYSLSDVALVTPLRDGMNLIAKEYVASRTDKTGVLILSEMAGAAKELGEAIIINPNDRREIAEALREGLQMTREEQERRNVIMQERLSRYDVVRWATDFVTQLAQMRGVQEQFNAKLASPSIRKGIIGEFTRARRRILFLDYDGTLVPFERRPHLATPTPAVLELLRLLAANPRNSLVLISGRDRTTLEQWFGGLPIGIAAEHGLWLRESKGKWFMLGRYTTSWKAALLPVLLQYADRLPGAFVEEKEHSLAWHYRAADPDQSRPVAIELMDNLTQFTANIDIQVLKGNKVLEIRNAGVNKGRAAMNWISKASFDFILAVGDDWTDEDLFESLPAEAYTFRVGIAKSRARFNLRHPDEVHELLHSLTVESLAGVPPA